MKTENHGIHTFKEDHGLISNYPDIKYKENSKANELIDTLSTDVDQQNKKKEKYKKNDLSELDLYNMVDLDEPQAISLMKNFFRKTEKEDHFTDESNNQEFITEKGIDYLNQTLEEAIGFYGRTLKRSVEKSFLDKRKKWDVFFRNTKDVLRFLMANSSKDEKTGVWERQVICSLMKIAHCINIKNQIKEDLDDAEKIFDDISERHIYPYFKNKQQNDINPDKMRGKCKKWEKWKYKTFFSIGRKLHFRWSARIKDDDMIILKMLSNPEYGDVSAINDIYGKRNECDNKEDALLLLQYHWINVYKRDPKTKLKVKNLFGKTKEETDIFIASMRKYLDKDFWQFLDNASHQRDDGKNNESYEDAKLIGPLTDSNGKIHSVETQFNLINNKNESHFSHHRIYKMKAIIEALVRLQWYVREEYIRHLIHVSLQEHKEISEMEEPEKIPELFYLWGNMDPNNSKPAEEAIFSHFLEQENIIPLHFKDGQKQSSRTYTTKRSRNRFHSSQENKNLYPENIHTK